MGIVKLECPDCGTRVKEAGRCDDCFLDDYEDGPSLARLDEMALQDHAAAEDY